MGSMIQDAAAGTKAERRCADEIAAIAAEIRAGGMADAADRLEAAFKRWRDVTMARIAEAVNMWGHEHREKEQLIDRAKLLADQLRDAAEAVDPRAPTDERPRPDLGSPKPWNVDCHPRRGMWKVTDALGGTVAETPSMHDAVRIAYLAGRRLEAEADARREDGE